MDQDILKEIISKVLEKLNAYTLSASHPKPIPTGVSNRHLHLSQQDLETLFGQGYAIRCIRDLSQPGQCAGAETVILAGPKGCLEQVRVLGPVRKQTQVEISRSDTYRLGVSAPTRESGNLKGSSPITIIGPKGSVQISEGLIIAQRHIHMTPSDAGTYGVKDSQTVQVRVKGERGVTFDNVVVRVSDKFALEFHIDTDEANGAGVKHGDQGYLLTNTLSIDSKTEIEPKIAPAADKMPAAPVAAVQEKPAALVTDKLVRDAWMKKCGLVVGKGAIFTPLAIDTIKELGVEIISK